MFDFSFAEMMLAGIVALVVLGPERLPKVARTAGEWVGKIQRLAANVKSELSSQAQWSDLNQLKQEVNAAAEEMRSEWHSVGQKWQQETQQINQLANVNDLPAWERLPEQRTPADFGIETTLVDEHGFPISPIVTDEPQPIGILTPSLRKQAMTRKRDNRPRHRPTPKLRCRK